jgi:glycosyltransferase involved in cell wall biosynthesis
MKIAINCWALRNKQLDGIGYFTVNTISTIIKTNPSVQFQILCDKNFTEPYFDFINVEKHFIFPALRHPLLYIFYLETVLPLFLKKHKPDVCVSMDGFLSLSSSCIQVPVIYDLNFIHYPKDLKLKNRLYYNFFFPRFAKKSKRIATISEYSKMDITNSFGINKNIVDVVWADANSNFFPLSKEDVETTRKKWSDGKPYFFFVGSMHPRKNIKRLIEAFDLFKQKNINDCKLLLAGHILWSKTEIEGTYNNSSFKNDIVFTGRLSDAELKHALGAAFALSFIPIFEGFGMPILEAMQSGVPVICSDKTSMPEIAGDAAILVDPFNLQNIAGAMQKMFYENELRESLIKKGFEQKKKFSWEKTAALLWETINKAINEN